MTTITDFQERFPEFCSVNDSRVQMFIDDAALLMSSKERWHEFYNVAQESYVAHLLTVALAQEMGDSSVRAPVSHKEVDDVVVKRAIGTISPTMDDLYSTSYGKRYVFYRRICFAGIYGV